MLDPITKLEVEDLLNRGFIVYVSSVDAKNSPFPEDVLLTSNDYSEVKESLNGNVSSNLKQRKTARFYLISVVKMKITARMAVSKNI